MSRTAGSGAGFLSADDTRSFVTGLGGDGAGDTFGAMQLGRSDGVSSHRGRSPVSKRSNDPPSSYVKFALARLDHEKRCTEHVAGAIASALEVTNPNLIEQAVLKRAAEHTLLAIWHGGWDLMFDEAGEFKGIVT